ncbi:MAG: BrnT family toxin [Treponemataceae bacterium]|nr:MAG: BrnT family toxin [Treponemataceae bacterium]
MDKVYKKYYTVSMPIDGVEWDSEKSLANFQKHHVSFDDAQYVFADINRLERRDTSESNTATEERYQTLGMVGKILFVVYTERAVTKRIITARVATKKERRVYNGYYQIDNTSWAKAT